MSVTDPSYPTRVWRQRLYRGEPALIAGFLDAIERHLLPPLVRDRQFEQSRVRPDRVRCYTIDTPTDGMARLWLQLVTPTRVRGGAVQILHPSPAASTLVGWVEQLGKACLAAATDASVRVTEPDLGCHGFVPAVALWALTRLADTADGEWPLTRAVRVEWDETVTACVRSGAALDPDCFRTWAEDSGWSRGAASEITEQFLHDSQLSADRAAMVACK